MNKPIPAKPRLYAIYFQALMEIAKDLGYNLLVSGSMNRDLDLVAVPWVDNPEPEITLIGSFDEYLSKWHSTDPEYYMHTILPGGRSAYVINLNRERDKTGCDPQYYLDISITPVITSTFLNSLTRD